MENNIYTPRGSSLKRDSTLQARACIEEEINDDNLGNTATSHYGDDTAPSPNIIFIYEVILVWGFSL